MIQVPMQSVSYTTTFLQTTFVYCHYRTFYLYIMATSLYFLQNCISITKKKLSTVINFNFLHMKYLYYTDALLFSVILHYLQNRKPVLCFGPILCDSINF